MPYPYAYYKENYNGPLHGTELSAPLLNLTPGFGLVPTDIVGGVLDATGKSHIAISTNTADVTVTNIIGGKSGQVILLRKTSQANILTLVHSSNLAGEIVTASRENLIFGNGRYGGAVLLCNGTNWYHIDNVGMIPGGSALSPGIAFGSDPDTGIYNKAANVIGFSAAGIERMNIGIATIASLITHRFADGTVAVPSISFTSDSDTGFYKATDSLNFSGDGVQRLAFFKDGSVLMSTPALKADVPFNFYTSSNAAQRIYTGGVLSSDTYVDSTLIPANGIYSKGHVKTAGQFQGTATSAQFADLAERYESDAVYPAGTIVDIGGDKEITIAQDPDFFGVISTAPGFKMNSDAGTDDTHPYVALTGRVPCRVIGKVKKGQRIVVSPTPGVGMAVQYGDGKIVGRALENKDTEEEGLVTIVARASI